VATAQITVAKDGRILASRMIESSGNVAMDRSVQDALDKVRRVPVLKPGAPSEPEQFTVTIRFNTENKIESLNWPPKSSDGAAGK